MLLGAQNCHTGRGRASRTRPLVHAQERLSVSRADVNAARGQVVGPGGSRGASVAWSDARNSGVPPRERSASAALRGRGTSFVDSSTAPNRPSVATARCERRRRLRGRRRSRHKVGWPCARRSAPIRLALGENSFRRHPGRPGKSLSAACRINVGVRSGRGQRRIW